MNCRSLLFCLVSLLVVSPHDHLSAEPVTFLSYNIHAGIGTDNVFDLERLAGVIEDSGAEIVALQEVDKNTRRSKQRDLVKELGELTGMQAIFGASIDYGGGQYGNAFLIRPDAGWKIESHHTHALPAPRGQEPRSVLELQLTSEHTTIPSLTVFSTHWCHREEENRLAAARFVNELMAGSDGTSILIGDLNATLKSPPLVTLFEAGWRNPSPVEVPTVPVISPKRQIDYLLLKSPLDWSTKEVRATDRPLASDHLPLLTVIEFSR